MATTIPKETCTMSVFDFVDRVRYEGPDSRSAFAFRHYDADRVLLGKTMREHLRLAVCYWHTFCTAGSDVFGSDVFPRPWFQGADQPRSRGVRLRRHPGVLRDERDAEARWRQLRAVGRPRGL